MAHLKNRRNQNGFSGRKSHHHYRCQQRDWRGDGTEIREIRDIAPGDSFRKIAWKASARRGRLMVREMEVDERDVIWVVVDVAAEGWSGPIGDAPLASRI